MNEKRRKSPRQRIDPLRKYLASYYPDLDIMFPHIKQMELATKLPICWLAKARSLKQAADLVFAVAHNAMTRIRTSHIESMDRDRNTCATSKPLSEPDAKDFEDTDLLSVYLMLTGMAVECLLKGLINVDRSMPITHDLSRLATTAEVPLSERAIELLNIMSEHIEWRGRYPAPLEVEALLPHSSKADPSVPIREFTPSLPSPFGSQYPDDKQIIDEMFASLWNKLREVNDVP